MKKKTYISSKNNRRSKKRVKLVFWLFFFLIIEIGISSFLLKDSSFSLQPNVFQPQSPQNSQNTASQNELTSDNQAEPASVNIDLNSWNMLLVNSDHPLTADFAPSTEELPNGIEVDKRIYTALTKMIADAKKENLNLVVCSGYRPYSLQSRLFEEQVQMEMANGHTEAEANRIAATTVAVPGSSEHQTGLAVDIVALDYQILDEKVLETEEVKWLYANCHKYGFIVRYPEGKSDITKIIYEPWHYRYVGVEAASIIMKQNLTLEEFIAQQQ